MIRNNGTNSNSVDDTLDFGQGLGPHLVGKQLEMNGRTLSIQQQLGEGGFSFVYLVRDGGPSTDDEGAMVLKITSVHSTAARLMAEKEAKLLRTLSHPSIVKLYDAGFRDDGDATNNNANKLTQHLILLEHCEGGTAFDAIKRLRSTSGRFDLPSLVIAFGQICNAVSYLHAQRPPVIHRDLKPVNFLVKNNSYKLCDFGSAVLGHTDLRTAQHRRKAEEVVAKTTTQMFRAPEMVDLYMSKRLTQSTDVWALGCCLYSLAFLRDCFEEGSNLAILSKKYKIPSDNPYGEGIVDLIDRMLTVDYKERADMSEVIMCLSAIYSERDLPKRKKRERGTTRLESQADVGGQLESQDAAAAVMNNGEAEPTDTQLAPRVGTYRTDGQGIRHHDELSPTTKEIKVLEAKKLNPNSAAAKRKKASETNKQKESIILPGCNNGGTGKKSSASASTRSETPISEHSEEFGNFASFDQAFDDTNSSYSNNHNDFDPFPSHNQNSLQFDSASDNPTHDNQSFSSAFDEQCRIHSPQSNHVKAAESSFEVTFQGFDSSVPSAFSTDDYYFSNTEFEGMAEEEGDRITSPPSSSKKFFGFGSHSNNDGSFTPSSSGAKKKRGMFGMLKR